MDKISNYIKIIVFWDWFDFGLGARIVKLNEFSRYTFAIDIQIAWFEVRFKFLKDKNKGTKWINHY